MFAIKTESGTFKTFNVKKIYEILMKTQDKEIKHFFDFELYTQSEFFKTYLRISKNYENYLNLEKKFNPHPTLKEYADKFKVKKKI
ncbi:hypothetical protein M1M25_gp020 [Tenacibaculum phage Gundel_1]|uniref:Uncharacterized protein n=1 Tax=Tenacibaculum phage Gundel_1 TaxID=2745672 RepID=A0A8E5EBK7_9CAUD|nr:hypothetical protein M1M25_gp020 [Tenacibaculum phage Gundel_1]QQV91451.1 hypothetical protein Gundel1_20 [Tenacibaculum phage Gundel_1]